MHHGVMEGEMAAILSTLYYLSQEDQKNKIEMTQPGVGDDPL
jgi:hypothetical protein